MRLNTANLRPLERKSPYSASKLWCLSQHSLEIGCHTHALHCAPPPTSSEGSYSRHERQQSAAVGWSLSPPACTSDPQSSRCSLPLQSAATEEEALEATGPAAAGLGGGGDAEGGGCECTDGGDDDATRSRRLGGSLYVRTLSTNTSRGTAVKTYTALRMYVPRTKVCVAVCGGCGAGHPKAQQKKNLNARMLDYRCMAKRRKEFYHQAPSQQRFSRFSRWISFGRVETEMGISAKRKRKLLTLRARAGSLFGKTADREMVARRRRKKGRGRR